MPVLYRFVQKSDAENMIEHLKCVGQESDNLSYGEDSLALSVEKEERFLSGFISGKRGIMLVAVDGDKIVGNAIVERNKVSRYSHRGEVSITVLKEYWGRGIGSELMKRLVFLSKNAGFEILELDVRIDNGRAIALYKKVGFAPIGFYDKYFKIDGKYYGAFLMNLYL